MISLGMCLDKVLLRLKRRMRPTEPESQLISRTIFLASCIVCIPAAFATVALYHVYRRPLFLAVGALLLLAGVAHGAAAATRHVNTLGYLAIAFQNAASILGIVCTGGVLDGSLGALVMYSTSLRYTQILGRCGSPRSTLWAARKIYLDFGSVAILTTLSVAGFNIQPLAVVPRWLNGILVVVAVGMDFFLFTLMVKLHKAQQDKVEAVSNARLQFLSKTSHEVRTPLNGVLGCLSVLKHSSGLTGEHLDLITTAEDSGLHLMTVLNDILDIAKIDSSKMELQQEKLNIVDELYMVVHNGHLAALRKGLEITFVAHRTTPKEVVGDAIRFRQIFINLIQNAVKFTEKGYVTVSVSCVSHFLLPSVSSSVSHSSEQMCSEVQEGRCVRVEVSDSGKGISQGDLSKVFDRFSGANRTTFSQFGGTGLGLNLARELVTMMGGHIDVHSEGAGRGASFVVEIPLPKKEYDSYMDLSEVEFAFVWINITSESRWRDALRSYLSEWGVDCSVSPVRPQFEGPMVMITHESCFFDVMQSIDGLGIQLSRVGVLTNSTDSIDVTLVPTTCPIERLKLPLKPSSLKTFVLRTYPLHVSDAIPASRTLPDLHELVVLIADDLTINRKVLRMTLVKCGVNKCDEACNGIEAVAKAKATKYDIIFMDLEMPELSGREATLEIRDMEEASGPHRHRSVVVGCTADAFPDTKLECLRSGFDDFIVKPISVDMLKDALARIATKPS